MVPTMYADGESGELEREARLPCRDGCVRSPYTGTESGVDEDDEGR